MLMGVWEVLSLILTLALDIDGCLGDVVAYTYTYTYT